MKLRRISYEEVNGSGCVSSAVTYYSLWH